MPMVNFASGGQIDFSNRYLVLSGSIASGAPLLEAQKTANVLAWGSFLTVSINFVILALVIFCMVRMINRLRSPAPSAEVAPGAPAQVSEEVGLLREIRDALRGR
jgi:large conductance mechanosensitive channel